MRFYSARPQELVRSFWRHRGLILALASRDVSRRYRGSVGGVFWALFNPILMLAVYTFVFSVVFRARWRADSESRAEFALVLFAGLILYNFFAECVTRAPGLIAAHGNYVKKVVFPLEILPWVLVASGLFHALLSILVWLAVSLAVFGPPPASIVFFPLVLLPGVLLTIGVCWVLASVGVYLRDTGQIVGILTMALLFLSPVFYPVTAIPEAYRKFLYLNPLTLVIESGRGALIWGTIPGWRGMVAYSGLALLVAWTGFCWFQKTRRGFADVV